LEKELQEKVDSTVDNKDEESPPKKRGRAAKVAGPSGKAKEEQTGKARGRPPKSATKAAAPDEEDAAPKKKRDRPSASAVKDEVAADEAPVKRRGRAPKAAVAVDTPPDGEAPVKKGRGRPQKSAAKDLAPANDEDAAPKKKRGRPAASAVEEDEEAPAKKGRGRPPKSADPKSADPASTDNEDAPAKKKRGRQAKAVENDAPDVAPAKNQRGRPSKADAQDKPAPATPSVKRGHPSKADAEATESAPRSSAQLSHQAAMLASEKKNGRRPLAAHPSGATPVSHGKRRASTAAEEMEPAPRPKKKRNGKAASEEVAQSERMTPDDSEPYPAPPKTEPHKRAPKQNAAGKRRKRQSSPGPSQSRTKHVKTDKQTEALEEDDGPKYWLLKAEPESRIHNGKDVKFSIDDLMNVDAPEPWSGVRNYVARNHMRAMKKGDLGFFYHSSCKVPGVVGILEVAEEATVDETAFDEDDPYFDPQSSREKPKWFCVSVTFRQKFDNPHLTSLAELKTHYIDKNGDKGALKDMMLFRQGRLSVSKVTKEEWNFILKLSGHLEHLAEAEKEAEAEKDAQAGAEAGVEDQVKDSQGPAAEEDFAGRLERMIENVDQAVKDIMQGVDHTGEDTVLDQTVEETILDADQTAEVAGVAEQIGDDLNGDVKRAGDCS
jgi:predicted RNA-binding protein with PUA-like domain